MKIWKQIVVVAVISIMAGAAPLAQEPAKSQSPAKDNSLATKIRRFAPTVMTANPTGFSPNDRKALEKIIEAAKYIDPLYLRQVWSGNEELLKRLQADHGMFGPARLHYFMINKAPGRNSTTTSRSSKAYHPDPLTPTFIPTT